MIESSNTVVAILFTLYSLIHTILILRAVFFYSDCMLINRPL